MKRHGGGRGGAKARGVLRDDKGFAPTGGNATGAPPGGSGAGGLPGGSGIGGLPLGNATGGFPFGNNSALPLVNSTGGFPFGNGSGGIPNISAPIVGAEKKEDEPTPEIIEKKLPQPEGSTSCKFLFKTDKSSFLAIIVFKKSGNLLCLGSIVDHNHILTTRRCVNLAEPHHLYVIVGCSKAWWGRMSQIKRVWKVLNHEYEAALLRLKSRIVFTRFVQPAKLPSSATKYTKLTYLYDTGPYYVMGFPVDKHDIPGEKIPKTLYYGTQSDYYFELIECEKFYTKYLLESSQVFCTRGGVDFCWGAWGAPVLVKVNGHLLQVGVVTLDSCTSQKAGPYVVFRTDAYADWIKGHLKEIRPPT